MTDETTPARRPRPIVERVTLDGQLLSYWEREALRLERLAAKASWGWVARGYARKAARARAQAERSRVREAARGIVTTAEAGSASETDSSG